MCSHGVGVNGVVPFPVSGVRFPLQAVMQLLQRFGACSGSAPDNFIAHQESGTTTYDTLSMMQKSVRLFVDEPKEYELNNLPIWYSSVVPPG